MSTLYSPFFRLSIQLFYCIWHLPIMLQISSCHIHPKKRCVDHNDVNNYWRLSNLYFIFEKPRKLVLSQVYRYVNSHNLYNTLLSAYRPCHSTDTALLTVDNDLFLSLSKGNMLAPAMRYFSLAFDTIDISIFVHCLYSYF